MIDEEMIEKVLEKSKDEYFITYIDDMTINNTYWIIWKVNNKYKEAYKILM